MNFLEEFVTIIPALRRHRSTYLGTNAVQRIDDLIVTLQNIVLDANSVIDQYTHSLQLAYEDTLDNKILPGLKSVPRYQFDVIELISNGQLFTSRAYIKSIDDTLNNTKVGDDISAIVIQLENTIKQNVEKLRLICGLINEIRELDANHNILFSKAFALLNNTDMLRYYRGLAEHNPAVSITSGLFVLDDIDPDDPNLISNIHRRIFEKTNYTSESIRLRKELDDAIRSTQG